MFQNRFFFLSHLEPENRSDRQTDGHTNRQTGRSAAGREQTQRRRHTARPILSQFYGLKMHRLTFPNLIKLVGF